MTFLHCFVGGCIWYIPRSGISRSYRNSIPSIFEESHCFQKGCINWHLYQQMRVSGCCSFWWMSVSLRCHLREIVNCISSMTSDMEHYYVYCISYLRKFCPALLSMFLWGWNIFVMLYQYFKYPRLQ